MPWQKLLLSRLSDSRGSAAVDFLLVLVPTSLLCLPLIELTSVFHKSIVNQQQVYEIARFASLADTNSADAEIFRDSFESTASIRYLWNHAGCVVSVSKLAHHPISLWPSEIEIVSEAKVQCEVE